MRTQLQQLHCSDDHHDQCRPALTVVRILSPLLFLQDLIPASSPGMQCVHVCVQSRGHSAFARRPHRCAPHSSAESEPKYDYGSPEANAAAKKLANMGAMVHPPGNADVTDWGVLAGVPPDVVFFVLLSHADRATFCICQTSPICLIRLNSSVAEWLILAGVAGVDWLILAGGRCCQATSRKRG